MEPLRHLHYVIGEELRIPADAPDDAPAKLSPVVVGPFFGRRGAKRLVAGKGRDARSHPELVGTGRIVTGTELLKFAEGS